MAENRQLREERDDVRNLGWLRDMERKTLEKEAERKEQAMRLLIGLGAPIIGNALGIPPQVMAGMLSPPEDVAPQGPPVAQDPLFASTAGTSREIMLLVNFFDSLSAEQLNQIAPVLTPTQQAILGELYKCVQERGLSGQGSAPTPRAPTPHASHVPVGQTNGVGA
jgi:hypothetical protein